MAKNTEGFLNDELTWDGHRHLLTDHKINKFKAMLQRVDMDKVNAMVDASKESLSAEQPKVMGPLADDPISEEIQFDDFAKIDLRVAKIVKAEHVEKADKLLRLELDLGGETRQVFAGIKSALPA